MTAPEPTPRRKLWRVAAIAGVLLGLACASLPPEYQTVCNAVANIASLSCGGA
jgi:hypothetical protein